MSPTPARTWQNPGELDGRRRRSVRGWARRARLAVLAVAVIGVIGVAAGTVLGATVRTPRTTLPPTASGVVSGTTWAVQAQYAWHNGSDREISEWVSPVGDNRGGGLLSYYVDCYT